MAGSGGAVGGTRSEPGQRKDTRKTKISRLKVRIKERKEKIYEDSAELPNRRQSSTELKGDCEA